MAAKQQGKKKARVPKRKNVNKKHQQARWNWKKLQAQKRKKKQPHLKRQAKRTSAAKSGSSGQPRKICSSKLFASKILRQLPKVRMEAKARNLMKTLLADLYSHVATQVEALRQKAEQAQALVSCNNVQTALKEAMEKELTKHMAEQPTAITTT
ncbi:H2B.v3H2B.v3-like [Podarcis lilfordi]|uniref:H2B.v3H2B.v3-like n=1 Tax=Podarcis lilfordi TaxID=74358 RepID=A0AA35JYY4_9SAUR|nr:H2B.v3H2B.v3-like [Podarcis lilfordi]